MATWDTPSVGQFIVMKIGQAISARKEAKVSARNRSGAWVLNTIRLMMHLAGFGCLTYAGFEWSTIAGFVVAGLSFFVLSTLMTTGTGPKATVGRDPMADRRQ